jgi:hypothetical protein
MQGKNPASGNMPIFNRVGDAAKRIGGLLYGLALLAIGGGILWWCGSVIYPYALGALRVGFAIGRNFLRQWLG